jgi:hypothetical protein
MAVKWVKPSAIEGNTAGTQLTIRFAFDAHYFVIEVEPGAESTSPVPMSFSINEHWSA